MLQVLCQILQTDSLVDVQAWLVSASDQGKNYFSEIFFMLKSFKIFEWLLRKRFF
jgi:hypothetical protein